MTSLAGLPTNLSFGSRKVCCRYRKVSSILLHSDKDSKCCAYVPVIENIIHVKSVMPKKEIMKNNVFMVEYFTQSSSLYPSPKDGYLFLSL